MLSTDEWLICFIYVFVKAKCHELPTKLALIENFILRKRKESQEILLTNLATSLELVNNIEDMLQPNLSKS
jgi:hypothetical protein